MIFIKPDSALASDSILSRSLKNGVWAMPRSASSLYWASNYLLTRSDHSLEISKGFTAPAKSAVWMTMPQSRFRSSLPLPKSSAFQRSWKLLRRGKCWVTSVNRMFEMNFWRKDLYSSFFCCSFGRMAVPSRMSNDFEQWKF